MLLSTSVSGAADADAERRTHIQLSYGLAGTVTDPPDGVNIAAIDVARYGARQHGWGGRALVNIRTLQNTSGTLPTRSTLMLEGYRAWVHELGSAAHLLGTVGLGVGAALNEEDRVVPAADVHGSFGILTRGTVTVGVHADVRAHTLLGPMVGARASLGLSL